MIRSSFAMFREFDPASMSILWSFQNPSGIDLDRTTLSENVEGFLLDGASYDVGQEGLQVHAEIELPSHALFGSIATSKSIVSAALEWLSLDSLNRRMGAPVPLETDGSFSFAKVRIDIPPGVLRRKFQMRLLLVLAQPVDPEEGMARTPGTILGSLETPVFRIDGSTSGIFPIQVVDDPSQAAWWVDDAIVDPETDRLEDGAFQLVLNRRWKEFHDELSRTGEVSPLQATIWANTIALLMARTATFRDAWKAVLQPEQPGQEGTILDLVRRWREENGWLDHPIRASDQLQRNIQRDLLRRSIR